MMPWQLGIILRARDADNEIIRVLQLGSRSCYYHLRVGSVRGNCGGWEVGVGALAL